MFFMGRGDELDGWRVVPKGAITGRSELYEPTTNEFPSDAAASNQEDAIVEEDGDEAGAKDDASGVHPVVRMAIGEEDDP